MQTMNIQQLEIALPSRSRRRRAHSRPCRVPRARWWFSQMRRVVDEAMEWHPGQGRDVRNGKRIGMNGGARDNRRR